MLTSVETRVQDAVLTAIEILVVPRKELVMKSANAPPGRSVDGNVLERDQRDFLGNIKGPRMTASSRINWHSDIKIIDEIRGNITVEEGDLLVNEKNIDRQKYAHHRWKSTTIEDHCFLLPTQTSLDLSASLFSIAFECLCKSSGATEDALMKNSINEEIGTCNFWPRYFHSPSYMLIKFSGNVTHLLTRWLKAILAFIILKIFIRPLKV